MLLYAKVWGSHSHATNLPTSDVDYLAVYQMPTREIVSLRPGPGTVDGKDPDFQAHELGKFCSLLMKGNPGIVECLFTEHMQSTTPVWNLLREKRDLFINRRTLEQYLGYGRGQLQRLKAGTRIHAKGGEYNTKWAYHMIRMALDAKRIAYGEPPLVMKDGDELKLLMDIRAGRYEPDEVAKMFEDIDQHIKSLHIRIKDDVDPHLLDEWLWRRRYEYLE